MIARELAGFARMPSHANAFSMNVFFLHANASARLAF